MSLLKQEIDALFWVDDTVPDDAGSDAYSISAIFEDRIHLRCADAHDDEVVLDFSSLDNNTSKLTAEGLTARESAATHLFLRELSRRREEAQREAEVDAMWRSAMVCQL